MRLHPSRRSVRFAAAALALALAVSLTGCVSAFLPKATSNTSSPAPVPAGVASDLSNFYSQKLHWTSCGSGMQCSTVTAPLDWANPSSGTVKLAVIRKPASGKRLGSLLVNPGGPGGSGYNFIKQSVDYATDATLRSHYDVVGWDPRGVGHSSAIKCYGSAGMNSYLYDITPGVRGSDAWIAASTASATAFAKACQTNSGALLGKVDTVSTARDLDLLRGVLGDKKLNYLGYSYGTAIGTEYAKLFPERTGHLVLDGALNPESSNFDVNEVQSEGFENSLLAYVTSCLKGSDCPFTGSASQAMTSISNLLAALDAHPIRNSDGRMLGANSMVTAIIYPLYDQGATKYENDLFSSVMQGNAKFAFELADAYNSRNANGTFSDNSTEAFTAINCLDYTYNDDPANMRAQAAQLAKAAPVLGPYLAYGDIQCAVWPYKSTVTRGPVHADGSAPIVVVGTTGDPATPYVWAKSLAAQLQNGHLVTYKGLGHTAYNKSNSCVNNAVDDFFVSSKVPKAGLTC